MNAHKQKYATHMIAPISNESSQLKWARAKRVKVRWQNGKIRAKEIPPDVVTEMKYLHDTFGLTYEKIGKLHGISRYLVYKALQSK